MHILWTDEALDDLAEIVAYYYAEASPRTAESFERRIVEQVEGLPPFPERIRKSDRIPGTRELVVKRLPQVPLRLHLFKRHRWDQKSPA